MGGPPRAGGPHLFSRSASEQSFPAQYGSKYQLGQLVCSPPHPSRLWIFFFPFVIDRNLKGITILA
jgi:hypothetical protein